MYIHVHTLYVLLFIFVLHIELKLRFSKCAVIIGRHSGHPSIHVYYIVHLHSCIYMYALYIQYIHVHVCIIIDEYVCIYRRTGFNRSV